MTIYIEKKIRTNHEKVELAAERFARLLIQQALEKRNNQIKNQIENKYGDGK